MSRQFELDVALNSQGVTEGAEAATQALGGLRGQAGLVNQALRAAIPIMGAYAGARGLGAAINSAATFEKQMLSLKSTVGESDQAVQQIRESTMELAADTGLATKQIVDGFRFARSAGLDMAESNDLVQTSAEAAAAGIGNVSENVRQATTILQAFGDEFETTSGVIDAIVGNAQAMELRVGKLGSALQRNVGIARQLDIDFNELAASIGSVSEIMGDANRGGRLFQGMITSLVSPTQKMRKQLERAGTSAAQLRESIQERGLVSTMVELRKSMEQVSDEGLGLIFEQQRLEAALNLTNREGARTREIMADVGDTTGEAREAFEDSGGTAREFAKASQELNNALIDAGNELLPSVTKALKNAAPAMRELGEATAWTIEQFNESASAWGEIIGLANRDFSSQITQQLRATGAQAERTGDKISNMIDSKAFQKDLDMKRVTGFIQDSMSRIEPEAQESFATGIARGVKKARQEGITEANELIQFLSETVVQPYADRMKKQQKQAIEEGAAEAEPELKNQKMVEQSIEEKMNEQNQKRLEKHKKELGISDQTNTSGGQNDTPAEEPLREQAKSMAESVTTAQDIRSEMERVRNLADQFPNIIDGQREKKIIEDLRRELQQLDGQTDLEIKAERIADSVTTVQDLKSEIQEVRELADKFPDIISADEEKRRIKELREEIQRLRGETPGQGDGSGDGSDQGLHNLVPFEQGMMQQRPQGLPDEEMSQYERSMRQLGRETRRSMDNAVASGIRSGFSNGEDALENFGRSVMRSLTNQAAKGINTAIINGISNSELGSGSGEGNLVSTAINGLGEINWSGFYGDTPGVQEVGPSGGMAGFAAGDKFVAAQSREGLRRQVGAGETRTGGGKNVDVTQKISFPVTSEQKIDRRIQKAAPQIAEQAKREVFRELDAGGSRAQTARNA